MQVQTHLYFFGGHRFTVMVHDMCDCVDQHDHPSGVNPRYIVEPSDKAAYAANRIRGFKGVKYAQAIDGIIVIVDTYSWTTIEGAVKMLLEDTTKPVGLVGHFDMYIESLIAGTEDILSVADRTTLESMLRRS